MIRKFIEVTGNVLDNPIKIKCIHLSSNHKQERLRWVNNKFPDMFSLVRVNVAYVNPKC